MPGYLQIITEERCWLLKRDSGVFTPNLFFPLGWLIIHSNIAEHTDAIVDIKLFANGCMTIPTQMMWRPPATTIHSLRPLL